MDLDLCQFSDICLADPHFFKPDSIDLILGADVYGQVLRSGLRQFPPSLLVAQDTALGWIVSGSIHSEVPRRAVPSPSISHSVMHCVSDDDLQEVLQRFWAVEKAALPSKKLNPEDEACKQLFVNTHS